MTVLLYLQNIDFQLSTIYLKYNMPAVVRDIKQQNWICVLYSLTLFSDGIQKYFQDQFILLHKKLQAQNQHCKTQCTVSCSKVHKDQINWCATCSIWKTSILSLHRNASTRRGHVDWTHIDSSKWPSDPTEVKKCFEPEWCRSSGSNCNPNLLDISIIIGCMSNCNHFLRDVRTIRDIRNTVSHNNKLTHEKKQEYCQTLLDFLQESDIWKYQEAKNVFDKILVFKDSTLEMIFQKYLLDEQQLNEIESRLFSKTTIVDRMKFIFWKTKTILLAILILILSVYVGLHNKKQECHFGYELEFKSYLDQHETFTGRQWLFDGITQRLMTSEKGLILIADPGYGKSAAIAQIINKRQNIGNFDVFYHLCRSDVRTLQQAVPFILHLFEHLLCNYPQFRQTVGEKTPLADMKNFKNSCKCDPLYFLDRMIIDPLMKINHTTASDLLMLVDALDECGNKYKEDSVLSVLRLRHELFPRWVQFMFTSRNDSVILNGFNSLSKWHLLRSSKDNKKDVGEFVRKTYLVTTDIAENIASSFEYNFLFTKFALRFENNIEHLPLTLDDAFQKEFDRLFNNCEPMKFRKPRAILEVLVATFQPLKLEDIVHYVSDPNSQFSDKYEFEEAFQTMLPHILHLSDNGDIYFIHLLLQEWLTQLSRRGHPCFVDIQKGHKAIAFARINKIMISANEVEADYVNGLINHLHFANEDIIFKKFTSLPIGVVDGTTCTNCMRRTICYSSVDFTANCINSFKLLNIILSRSKSKNITQAVVLSITSNNTESLRALIAYGHIDVSAYIKIMVKFNIKILDLEYEHYKDTDVAIDGFNVLHFAIFYKNVYAFKLIINYNSSALHIKTRNGISVLALAAISEDVEILKLCLKSLPIEEDILQMSSYKADDASLKLLLQHGAKDVCVKCKRGTFKKKERKIYYVAHNKTIDIDENINHIVDQDLVKLIRELTCECVLHTAVRSDKFTLVRSIVNKSRSTIECVDFQGLTPLASAIIFQRPTSFAFLLQMGANIHFICKPSDVINRISILRQLQVYMYSPFYTDLFVDRYCSEGATIGHILTLNPSCEIMKVIVQHVEIREIIEQRDKELRNPLFFLLCRKRRWGPYHFDADVLSNSKHLYLLLFIIASVYDDSDSLKLLTETGICGNKIQITSMTNLPDMCSYAPENIPDIKDLFIKTDKSIHKGDDIRNLFPIYKEVKLTIVYKPRHRSLQTIISIKATPRTGYT